MRILLVDDNPGDIRLIREAFRETGLKIDFHVAEDGELALTMLRRQPPFANLLRPALILLDLNLPKVDGAQVLASVKSDPELRIIPVIILSSSRRREDVIGSYDGYANCYIHKPMAFHDYLLVAQGIQEFWLKLVSLPGNSKFEATAG